MLTVPVHKKGARDQKIAEVLIDDESHFAEKHIRAIEHALSKAPFFKDYAADLFAILQADHPKLADLNISLIAWLAEALGISCRFLRSSAIDAGGAKADLLANICGALDAEVYISAPGSREYIESSDAFDSHGIAVAYHRYEHPVYPQLYGDFEPYMSAIDLLFNLGPQSLERIRSGYMEELTSAP
jgi:hypothetical protein